MNDIYYPLNPKKVRNELKLYSEKQNKSKDES